MFLYRSGYERLERNRKGDKWMSEWKVLFEENFWGCAREEDPAFEAGMEIDHPLPTVEHPVNQTVSWCGETWKILSVYTCERLVRSDRHLL